MGPGLGLTGATIHWPFQTSNTASFEDLLCFVM